MYIFCNNNNAQFNAFIFFLVASDSKSISNVDIDMNKDISKMTVEDDNSTKYLNINEGLSYQYNEPASY